MALRGLLAVAVGLGLRGLLAVGVALRGAGLRGARLRVVGVAGAVSVVVAVVVMWGSLCSTGPILVKKDRESIGCSRLSHKQPDKGAYATVYGTFSERGQARDRTYLDPAMTDSDERAPISGRGAPRREDARALVRRCGLSRPDSPDRLGRSERRHVPGIHVRRADDRQRLVCPVSRHDRRVMDGPDRHTRALQGGHDRIDPQ